MNWRWLFPIGALILVLGVASGLFYWRHQDLTRPKNAVSSTPVPTIVPTPNYDQPDMDIECVTAGCSNTLCVPKEEQDQAVSTCEFKPEYECYEYAVCEQQITGNCGWTQTPEFDECLGKLE